MTPAEFRCLREYLGLSTQWVAVQLGVGPRAVLRWETPGTGDVPQRAAELLVKMRGIARNAVDAAQTTPKGQTLMVPPHANAWQHGFPPAWHRHIAVRIAEKLGANVLAINYEKEVN